jgi:hypothetical protein
MSDYKLVPNEQLTTRFEKCWDVVAVADNELVTDMNLGELTGLVADQLGVDLDSVEIQGGALPYYTLRIWMDVR